MSSSMGGAAGSGDEGSNKGKRPAYKRLTSAQTAKLEKFIIECPHPDEAQRRQLAADVGIEPKQVKFWFQNKRTQIKSQHERADNSALRVENDRIQSENLLMKEALNNILCPACGGPPLSGEEHELYMHKMLLENAQLKEEHEKVSNLLARYLEKQVLPPDELLQRAAAIPNIAGGPSSSYDLSLGSLLNQTVNDEGPSSLHQNFVSPTVDSNMILPNPNMQGLAMEKALVSEVAATATEELVRLLRINEPFWVSSSTLDGKLILHRESYERIFPRANHFRGANARVESSKESGIVSMSGIQLVDLFLDADKWVNLFPTIVAKAETIQIFENGLPESRSGALQLMYEEMHILSPLVPSREFHFLRCCQQLEVGLWVITDVSYDSVRENPWRLSRSWRHPSGCMIQDLHNGCCMVTWVEHVEVDDKIQTHRLYRDLVSTNLAYGAERWIMELQRMCERSASYFIEKIPDHEYGGVISSIEGRRSVMKLSHRMVKIFCESLNMTGKLDFPQLTVENNSGVRVSVRKSTELGQPNGTIVIAATSLWLPLHYQKVFDFLTDVNKRVQWDVLSCTTPVHKIAQISNGIYTGNNISIIQPYIPSENNALILQESFLDPVGSYIVYAPADLSAINVVVNGEDSAMIPILPSGFVVSGDGRSNDNNVLLGAFSSPENGDRSEGSLLTVAFQILVSSPGGSNQVNMESVASVNTLLTSTVQKVKEALNCSSLA